MPYFPGAALITDGDNSEQNSPLAVSSSGSQLLKLAYCPRWGEASALGGFLVSKARWPSNQASESLQLPIKILAPNWHSTTIFGTDE